MTVRTTYFGGLGSIGEPAEDDLVLGVVRYPRDFVSRVTDRNIPALAPPDSLLNPFKTVETAADKDGAQNPSAVAWRSVDFADRYRDYLATAGPQHMLAELREHTRDRYDLWLVCWEKDVRYCHRRVLADVLVDGLDVTVEHHPSITVLEAMDADTGEETTIDETTLLDFGRRSA